MSPHDIICDAVGDRELAQRVVKALEAGGYTFVQQRYIRDLEASAEYLALSVARYAEAEAQRDADRDAIWRIPR